MENEINEHIIIPESLESYEQLSELNDMKQHADKIIQGIKKLEENDANRAIWELFQNAVDLSSECEINIKLTEETMEFSHNGIPFTPMTLDCLFKQVSSKTLEERKTTLEEGEPVGQYGTGFITTHSFGKEIIIDGALIKGNGYIPIQDFVIDRHTDNWKVLGGRIRDLKKSVGQLLNKEEISTSPYPPTKFTYKTNTKHNKECSEKAIKSLRLIIPYVMTLNSRLKKVKVIEKDGSEILYIKKSLPQEGQLHVSEVLVNDIPQKIYSLQSDDKRINVILPLSENYSAKYFEDELPRLFLYYPLIGTQTFGVNYLIHSRHFQPTEPRNGLYLNSENEDNQKEEKANKELLDKASKMIFDFVNSHSGLIINPIKLAKINFNINSDKELLNNYFKELKNKWTSEFKVFPLVETEAGNIKPSDAVFLNAELLPDEKTFDSIYALVNQFWKNTPKKHLVKEWTTIIDEWALENVEYIGFKDLALKIQAEAKLSAFQNAKDLQVVYTYLLKEGHGELFNNYKLLPNLKGEFRQLSGLNNNLSLPNVLIEIADVIMPDVPQRHIHSDFKFNLELPAYTRKNYVTEINAAIAIVLNDNTLSKSIDSKFLEKLIEYCKISATNDSESIPSKLVKLICQYYNQEEGFILLPAIKEDELEIRTPQKKLIRLFLNDLSKKESIWVEEKIDFLKNVIEIGASYTDYEEMFKALSVFPNQLNELTVQSYLQIDGNIPDEIKDLYDKVVKPDYPIRSNLVHSLFAPYLKNKEKRTVRSLTEKIESEFFETFGNVSISNHPFKKEILHLIEQIKSSSEFEKYFPLIFSKRSAILVELADGEDTFSILSLDGIKIKKLADLAKNPNIDEIIKLGHEAFLRSQQERGSFKHKYTIGTHIEKVLRESLITMIPEDIKADIQDVQDGQDIIIHIKEIPVFYIEVKSRWDANNSVRMSRNQTLRANEQKTNYALCSVDMSKYEGENKYEVEDIEDIRNLIKFNIDIGEKVIHLIDILNQTEKTDTIHLDGDFRTVIPQNYIDEGKILSEFESFLIEFLKTK